MSSPANVNVLIPHRDAKKKLGYVAVNLANTILGSGLLGVPLVLKQCGLFTGMLLLLLITLCNIVSMHLLVQIGRFKQLFAYSEVCEEVLGVTGFYVVNSFTLFITFGCYLSYVMACGDILESLGHEYVGDFWFTSRTALILLTSSLFILPMLFFRSIHALVKLSAFSTLLYPVSIGLLALVSFWKPHFAPAAPFATIDEQGLLWVGSDVMSALGIIMFSFGVNQAAFGNFRSLVRPTENRFLATSAVANCFGLCFACAIGLTGFLTFGASTQGNILQNYTGTNGLIAVAEVLFFLTLLPSYPLQFYPSRVALTNLVGLQHTTRLQHAAVTIALFSVSILTAVLVTDLGSVFSITGGFAAGFITFVLPPVLYAIVFWEIRGEEWRRRGLKTLFTSLEVKAEPADIGSMPFILNEEETVLVTSGALDVLCAVILLVGIYIVFVASIWSTINLF